MSNLSRITVFPDGPLQCEGAFALGDSAEETIYLCRCGKSANKPLCDGSHQGAFEEPAKLTPNETADAAPEPDTVQLQPLENGPVMAKGPFALVAADGTVVSHHNKAALCRCGASANAPFCDGAHRACGFTARS